MTEEARDFVDSAPSETAGLVQGFTYNPASELEREHEISYGG
jgi:hypothetical protein